MIKGSEQALEQRRGYLDQDGYCDLSSRTQATFASQRDTIYRLFQAYLKRKKERGAFVSVYPDDLSALVTVKDKYLSALAGQVEFDSGMIWGQLVRNI